MFWLIKVRLKLMVRYLWNVQPSRFATTGWVFEGARNIRIIRAVNDGEHLRKPILKRLVQEFIRLVDDLLMSIISLER